MRAGALLVAVLAVAPALGAALTSVDATPVVSTSEDVYTPRTPIHIAGDGDLALTDGSPNLANGVVSGSGTADDPYVIRGWDILPTQRMGCGISVRDTSAHLRIEENRVEDALGSVPTLLALPVGLSAGICLDDVENVVVAGNVIAHPNGDGVRVTDGVNVAVEDNTIQGPGASGVLVRGATPSVRVTGNVVEGFYIGLYHRGGDLVAEGNTLTGHAWAAVELTTGADHVLRDNTLSESRAGVRALHSHLTLEGNTIKDNLEAGVLARGVTATIHDNRIVGNGDGVVLATHLGVASVANATANWWGDASGPGGAGNGTGDTLYVDTWSNAAYDPWLEAPEADAGGTTSTDGTLDDGGLDTTSTTDDSDTTTDTNASLTECQLLGTC